MIYKVIVKCFGEQLHFKKKPKRIECRMAALVEADNSDEAITVGVEHIQAQAPIDVRWKAFEFASCAGIQMPILINRL